MLVANRVSTRVHLENKMNNFKLLIIYCESKEKEEKEEEEEEEEKKRKKKKKN